MACMAEFDKTTAQQNKYDGLSHFYWWSSTFLGKYSVDSQNKIQNKKITQQSNTVVVLWQLWTALPLRARTTFYYWWIHEFCSLLENPEGECWPSVCGLTLQSTWVMQQVNDLKQTSKSSSECYIDANRSYAFNSFLFVLRVFYLHLYSFILHL